jgi:hypothetical protein
MEITYDLGSSHLNARARYNDKLEEMSNALCFNVREPKKRVTRSVVANMETDAWPNVVRQLPRGAFNLLFLHNLIRVTVEYRGGKYSIWSVRHDMPMLLPMATYLGKKDELGGLCGLSRKDMTFVLKCLGNLSEWEEIK